MTGASLAVQAPDLPVLSTCLFEFDDLDGKDSEGQVAAEIAGACSARELAQPVGAAASAAAAAPAGAGREVFAGAAAAAAEAEAAGASAGSTAEDPVEPAGAERAAAEEEEEGPAEEPAEDAADCLRRQEAEAFARELELEAAASDRMQPQEGEVNRGVAGALISIDVSWQLDRPGVRSSLSFVDAVNAVIPKMHKLLALLGRRGGSLTARCAAGLEGRVDSVLAALSLLLQQRFQLKFATQKCKRIFGLFWGVPSAPQGLHGLLQAVLEASGDEHERLAMAIDASLQKIVVEVIALAKYAYCLRHSDQAVLRAIMRELPHCVSSPLEDQRRVSSRQFPGVAVGSEVDIEFGYMCPATTVVSKNWTLAELAERLRELMGRDDDIRIMAYTGPGGSKRPLPSDLRLRDLRCVFTFTHGNGVHSDQWHEEIETADEVREPRRTPLEETLVFEALQDSDSNVEATWVAWPEWVIRWRLSSGRLLKTSPVTATRVLWELRSLFQTDEFQDLYHELLSAGERGQMSWGQAKAESLEMSFAVQRAVLPKYGYTASPKGVAEMREEMSVHADWGGDAVVAKVRRDIHVLLGMVRACPRRPDWHNVGDSHCLHGWPPHVIPHHQGPLLCYNVHRVDLRQLRPPLKEGDALCLCFGEIDCRGHVHKHVLQGTPHEQVIDEIVARYFAHVKAQMPLLPLGVQVFIYNVVPPARQSSLQNQVSELLPVGSDQERKSYVLYFNKRLRAECRRAGYHFFDVYDRHADVDGLLDPAASDGSVHIGSMGGVGPYMQALPLSLKCFMGRLMWRYA